MVEPETVIGIIEVMKLMNSVPANLRGEVVEVLAKDGELVEYDQVLMRVRAVQG
ncbi:acetyl-CoA carboxylase biotin carboxyl carrier protein [Neopusillimonas aromaticivorans]|uniref:acetyl-CoA carboxylase biotin carboxyl carrier protein n=1 Tax=Neopusillimonas aromaticivorans TaxID=2979868 RepID=UPI002593BEC9|nr:biotin/lipoyl-containing protein [Neopusillimonas aromaticivorans]WJJ94578.1 biotin/lipoyl-containing protein [Neopusillimonas aromaticivorans]